MNFLKKHWKWIAISVAVIIVAYLAFKPEMDAAMGFKPDGLQPEAGKESDETSKLEKAVDRDKILKRGVRGPEVQLLQIKLNRDGAKPALATDGIFGMKTLRALKDVAGEPMESITLKTYDLGPWVKKDIVPADMGYDPLNPLGTYVEVSEVADVVA